MKTITLILIAVVLGSFAYAGESDYDRVLRATRDAAAWQDYATVQEMFRQQQREQIRRWHREMAEQAWRERMRQQYYGR